MVAVESRGSAIRCSSINISTTRGMWPSERASYWCTSSRTLGKTDFEDNAWEEAVPMIQRDERVSLFGEVRGVPAALCGWGLIRENHVADISANHVT